MMELTELPIWELASFIGLLVSSFPGVLDHSFIDTLRWTKLLP